MTMDALLLAAGLLAGSGLPGLAAARGARWGDWLHAGTMVLAAALGSGAALAALLADAATDLDRQWALPWGRFGLHLDALSAAFLLPVFVVPALGSIYGAAYWRQGRAPGARSLRVFYGLLAGAMVMVL